MLVQGKEVTEGQRDLLMCIIALGGHVSERNGRHYLIPTPGYNWDSRIELKYVLKQEDLPPLVEAGFLAEGTHAIERPHADYSPCGETVNRVLSLTELGKGAKAELFSE